MIYVTGDTHGNQGYGGAHDLTDKLSRKKFKEGKELTKSDYVIIVGDFGFIFSNTSDGLPTKEEAYWLKWLDNCPWTTLFLDGNHENFDRLYKLPEIDMFEGKVGKAGETIFHLKRGQVYDIDGYTFFTFGGAQSVDKARRVPGLSWWPQEEPSTAEIMQGMKALEESNFEVDYVLTHTAPASIAENMDPDQLLVKYQPYGLTKFLDEVKDRTKFKKWFFGHFHDDEYFEDGKFQLIYKKVVRVL